MKYEHTDTQLSFCTYGGMTSLLPHLYITVQGPAHRNSVELYLLRAVRGVNTRGAAVEVEGVVRGVPVPPSQDQGTAGSR